MNEEEFVAQTISIYDKASPPFLSPLSVYMWLGDQVSMCMTPDEVQISSN
jgi:hypothetical protein